MAEFNLDKRVETLQLVDLTPNQKTLVEENLKAEEVDGDWEKFIARPDIDGFAAAKKTAMKWAYNLGDWSLLPPIGNQLPEDDTRLVEKLLADHEDVKTFRDLALEFSLEELKTLVGDVMPDSATDLEKSKRALLLRERLYGSTKYEAAPTAVITRLVEDKVFGFDDSLNAPLLAFLKANATFKFERTETADIKPDVAPFSSIDAADRDKVVVALQNLDAFETDIDWVFVFEQLVTASSRFFDSRSAIILSIRVPTLTHLVFFP